jgi:methyl-accepting chemotaxis protein
MEDIKMRVRSLIGRFNPANLTKAGIRVKLQLAFGAVALMTVVASGVAILSFRSAEHSVERIAEREVPLMTEALRLSVTSGEISAGAARFVSADNIRDQRQVAAQIEDRSMQLRMMIDKVRAGSSNQAFGAVDVAARLLENNLSDLDTVIQARTSLRALLDRKLDTLHKLHTKITEELTPIVNASYVSTVNKVEEIGKVGDRTARSPVEDGTQQSVIQNQLIDFRNALELKIQTHLIASLINEGAVAKTPDQLKPLLDRFSYSANTLMLAAQGIENAGIRKDIDALLELGQGSDGVFTMRQQELSATAGASRVINENQKIQKQLDDAVSVLVKETETGMRGGTTALLSELAHSRLMLIVVAIASLLAAGLIAFFYVQRNLVRRLSTTCDSMRRLAAGDNDVAITGVQDGDEIGEMARALTVFREAAVEKERLEAQAAQDRQAAEEERARSDAARAEAARQVAQVVDGLGRGLERLAEGDLTYRVREGWASEYTKIQDDFNGAIDQLQETLTAIVESTREVSSASLEISSSTTDLSQRTEEQAANLEQTSASMEEISATVKKNAESAQHANGLMRGTRDVAGRGGEVVSQAVSAMSRIEDSSRKISDIISVIDEIARQTNLLALNAAVEAARAGEAGRGFAVVAAEVRNLAQRSSQAAKDIKDLITNSSNAVGQGVQLVNRAGESLKEILQSINEVAGIVADIANASAEQATGIDQVNKALSQMDEVTQQNSALVEENAATAKTLEHQSQALDGRVAVFRLYEDGEEVPVPSAPVQTRTPQPVRKPAAVRGTARQMQTALATAVAKDQWEEF